MKSHHQKQIISSLQSETPTLKRNDVGESGFDFSIGTAGGLTFYALAQSFPESAMLPLDEIGSVSTGLAAGVVGALAKMQSECGKQELLKNYKPEAAAAGAGLVTGLSVAGITGGSLVMSLADGGTTFVCVAVPTLMAHYYKNSAKTKICPGLNGGDRHSGICTQKICRECFCLFFPDEKSEGNIQKKWISAYELFSFLHFQGLSVLDGIAMIEDEDFNVTCKKSDAGLRFNVKSLETWIDKNERLLAIYQGKGKKLPNETKQDILSQLNL